MNDEHKRQRYNCTRMMEALELAKSYCELMRSCAPDTSEYALMADVEPGNIQKFISDAEYQLSLIGAEWESITRPDKEH